jgi:hypothetical protein
LGLIQSGEGRRAVIIELTFSRSEAFGAPLTLPCQTQNQLQIKNSFIPCGQRELQTWQ